MTDEALLAETRDFIRRNVALEDRGYSSPCWIWQKTVGANGYGGSRRLGQHGAHRVSYIAFIGPIEPGMMVCHSCDVRVCVNPDHLWKGTNLDNMRDMATKGRSRSGAGKGSDHGRAKLTEDQVLAIRASKKTARQAALEYGVAMGTIAHIRARTSWRHI